MNETHITFVISLKGAARQICCRRNLFPITQDLPRSLPIPCLTTAAPSTGWPKPAGLTIPGAAPAFMSHWHPASPLSQSPKCHNTFLHYY